MSARAYSLDILPAPAVAGAKRARDEADADARPARGGRAYASGRGGRKRALEEPAGGRGDEPRRPPGAASPDLQTIPVLLPCGPRWAAVVLPRGATLAALRALLLAEGAVRPADLFRVVAGDGGADECARLVPPSAECGLAASAAREVHVVPAIELAHYI